MVSARSAVGSRCSRASPNNFSWLKYGPHGHVRRASVDPPGSGRKCCAAEVFRDVPDLPEEVEHRCPRRLSGFGVIAKPPEFGALWQAPHIEGMTGVGVTRPCVNCWEARPLSLDRIGQEGRPGRPCARHGRRHLAGTMDSNLVSSGVELEGHRMDQEPLAGKTHPQGHSGYRGCKAHSEDRRLGNRDLKPGRPPARRRAVLDLHATPRSPTPSAPRSR